MIGRISYYFRSIRQYLETDVLIYSMGKVGSNSLSHSLEKRGLQVSSKHYFGGDEAHFFNKKSWNLSGRLFRRLISILLRARRKPCKVISLVRDPLGRNVSLAFFNLEYLLYHTLRPGKGENIKGQNWTLHQIIEKGKADLINPLGPIHWFDEEFGVTTGVDVYQYPFDQQSGYCIIEQDHFQILLLQMEKLQNLEKVIGDFMEMDDFRLLRANSSDNNWYAEIYRDFKKQYLPSSRMLDQLYQSKYMQHFYSQEEIASFEQKWQRRVVD
ncbi:MAG: putative capsular polysaccharide synthesis family protein [Bacteroidota bacterium]